MKRTPAVLAIFLILAAVDASAITGETERALVDRATRLGEPTSDAPLRNANTGLRSDTTWYGSYEVIGDEYYAISSNVKSDVMWTFDRGIGPVGDPDRIENGEGWKSIDLSNDPEAYFRVVDESLDLGPGVPSPVIAGERSVWIGAEDGYADTLCWECGAGYGNSWSQRFRSPLLSYNGSGDISLGFDYWSKSEPCYDGTQVYLKRADGTELMLNPYPPGTCLENTTYAGGTFTDSIGHYSNPAAYSRVITAAEIGGAQEIRIIFEFISDGGWSDEDCDYPTIWGPFGTDNVSISGGGINVSYDFEDGLQGWIAAPAEGVGRYAGISNVDSYTLFDPCGCTLEGNVLELHDDEGDLGFHPEGQRERIESPICDLGGPEAKEIFMDLYMYGWVPGFDCLRVRPGWRYYPYRNSHGIVHWSPRVGQNGWWAMEPDVTCGAWRASGTATGALPPEAEQVIAVFDLFFSAEAFSIPPCEDDHFSPLLDNLAVGVLDATEAPLVSLDTGAAFQDVGSSPGVLFDARSPGPANITFDLNMDTEPGTAPDICGDSLVVVGPEPFGPTTRWEARLWWRVARRGARQEDINNGAESRYKIWKDRVSDGRLIDRPYQPEFTFGWMDSVEIGHLVKRNKFKSEFREDDDDFVGEGSDENEMIWDDVLFPGSRIDYFVTANYTVTPNELYYLPDTTGGYFYEFEVLPGLSTAYVPDCGGAGFDHCVFQPSTLYIDASNRGAQVYIENALRTLLNGAAPCTDIMGCEIPRNRLWDRYDYLDSASNWNAPFVRGSVVGSINGMTLNQILGYRTILVNTGAWPDGCMQDEDFGLFDQWLVASDCDSNVNRQVFIINGDKAGEVLEEPGGQMIDGDGLAFMTNTLGAALYCDAFNGLENDPDCGDENTSYCVRVLPTGDGYFGTDLDVDGWGSYCPNGFGFNVYSLNGGTGNRYYSAEDGMKEMSYAQVANEDLSGEASHRTILSSPSWHHTTRRDPGGTGSELCPRDLPSIVEAGIAEIGAALKWGFDVDDLESIPTFTSAEELATCQSTWQGGVDVDETLSTIPVNRLYQNQPNPFNPTTTIRFQTAQAGHVEITINDVSGRRVKTLVDERLDAGPHSVTWDGTNNLGHKVGSGIYWSQMRTDRYISNKKVAILK